ncbi:MAG TPA: hypothetical protein VFJ05_06020 [Nitrososphaeraceae archaeon]|nr:hypothetical protein [Nitrososphaeraceae archaeon]
MGYIPDPGKPGWLKYDRSERRQEYKKLLNQEAQKRVELMIEIMRSRSISYDNNGRERANKGGLGSFIIVK